MRDVERIARREASPTRGLVRVRDLRKAGIASSVITRRVQRGVWSRPHDGVVDVTGEAWTWERRVQAAVLACPEGTLASHRTAAALLGLPGFPRSGAIEVTAPRSSRSRNERRPFTVHSTTRPAPGDTIDGIPTTTPLRVGIDLATCTRDRPLARAWRELLRRGLTTPAALMAPSQDRLHGVARARALVLAEHALVLHGTESPLEDDVVERLRRVARLPAFVTQHPVTIAGRRLRLDVAWPQLRTVLEVDGARWHADQLAVAADREREALLTGEGWTVLRVTAADLVDGARWELVTRRLRRALACP